MKTHVGTYIREHRTTEGISLRALSSEVGLSDVFLSQVERGKKRLARDHWNAIAEALPSVDLDELETRAELDDTMSLELDAGADAALALQLARKMTSTPLTDEVTNSLIEILNRSSGRE